MISLAIAIGIIEDKIANDLTSKDTKARECLEDVKAKISRHKPKQYKVEIHFKQGGVRDTYEDDYEIQGGFFITTSYGEKMYFNKDLINEVNVKAIDTEDEYVEGTTRGLVDL